MCHTSTPAQDFLSEVRQRSYGTILADPPWQFSNRTGKMAPEHRRLSRYPTLTLQAIKAIPVATLRRPRAAPDPDVGAHTSQHYQNTEA